MTVKKKDTVGEAEVDGEYAGDEATLSAALGHGRDRWIWWFGGLAAAGRGRGNPRG